MDKKRMGLTVIVCALALSLGLAACDGASTQEPAAGGTQTGTADEQSGGNQAAGQSGELDPDAILDIVDEACPINLMIATNVKVGLIQDGRCTVTFDSEYGPFSYTVDVTTGEIVEKVEPEVPEQAASDDPIERAVQAVFETVEGYNGGAQNTAVKVRTEDGVQMVEVEFDWGGQHYDMVYNMETGEVSQR